MKGRVGGCCYVSRSFDLTYLLMFALVIKLIVQRMYVFKEEGVKEGGKKKSKIRKMKGSRGV